VDFCWKKIEKKFCPREYKLETHKSNQSFLVRFFNDFLNFVWLKKGKFKL
jgi:hypothetical protein